MTKDELIKALKNAKVPGDSLVSVIIESHNGPCFAACRVDIEKISVVSGKEKAIYLDVSI